MTKYRHYPGGGGDDTFLEIGRSETCSMDAMILPVPPTIIRMIPDIINGVAVPAEPIPSSTPPVTKAIQEIILIIILRRGDI